MAHYGIKRIHRYMAQQFLPLLVMTVMICWFVVVMQFMWQYTDDFIGKGLSITTLAKVFMNASLMALPTALPLGILLASLMTFGGLGERLELLAIKSAGVPLHKVMVSLAIICFSLGLGLFLYLNTVMMNAQVSFYQIVFSARSKQPDLEIPEGSFYNGIDNYSIFVKKKNHKAHALLGVLIYDLSEGFDETRIIRADSGILSMDISKTFLTLDLYKGESFQQLKEPISPTKEKKEYSENVPPSYYKGKFAYKRIVIPFDANFTLQNDESLRNQFVGKNYWQLTRYINDTAIYALDSIGVKNASAMLNSMQSSMGSTSSSNNEYTPGDEIASVNLSYYTSNSLPMANSASLDSLFSTASPELLAEVAQQASEKLKQMGNEAEYMFNEYDWQAYFYRTHDQERHRKFTFPIACILFFFIGAPLGAIIRKGGIGTPMVASVLLFIVYHMIDTYGYKMGYNGQWPVWIGMWLSSFFLLPLGIVLTYQATRDSVTLNLDNLAIKLKNIVKPQRKRELRIRELITQPLTSNEATAEIEKMLQRIATLQNSSFYKKGTLTHHALCEANYQQYTTYIASEHMINRLLDMPGYVMPTKLSQLPILSKRILPFTPKYKWITYTIAGVLPLSLPIICYLYIRRSRERKRLKLFEEKLAILKTELTSPT